MDQILYFTDRNNLFSYTHIYTEHPKFTEFNLHAHDDYEIFIFLKGDVNFLVEGMEFCLNPYDILLIRGNELHQKTFQKDSTPYERIVISLSDSFFDAMDCPQYREIFNARCFSMNEDTAYQPEEILKRIEHYLSDSSQDKNAVIRSCMVELFHMISQIPKEKVPSQHPELLAYINAHLAEPLSLDELAEHFFLSKYYLCRLFKKMTGFTINQYIITKRLLLAIRLFREGKSLSDASTEAGFGCYENFYKAYVKEFGISPRQGLKQN